MWSHCTLKTMTKKDRQISEKSEFMRYKTIEFKLHANDPIEKILTWFLWGLNIPSFPNRKVLLIYLFIHFFLSKVYAS